MKLLEPIKIGNSILPNSMAMAPMTRSRATMEGVVGDSTILYYTQRANPDLPKRFELNAALNQADSATMHGGKDQGYIDYPFLNN